MTRKRASVCSGIYSAKRKSYFVATLIILVGTFWPQSIFGNTEPKKSIDPHVIDFLERSVSQEALELFLAGVDPVSIVLPSGESMSAIIKRFNRGEAFEVPFWTVDGGGVINSTGGGFSLSGTTGQPDAANPMIGGDLTLFPGFWRRSSKEIPPEPCEIFCDGFESGDTAAWSS